MKSIHIGKVIQEQVAKSNKQHKQIADEINRTPQALRDMFDREHISTDMLLKLKEVLGYDFFKHYVSEEEEGEPPIIYEQAGEYNLGTLKQDNIVTVQFNLQNDIHLNLFKQYLTNIKVI